MPIEPWFNILFKVGGFVVPMFGKPLNRWWRRRQIPSASGESLSILVAKISGDNSADSSHHSIREAIRKAMPAVTVIGWSEELPIGDGLDQAAQEQAATLARTWMKAKNCDLIISGRIKSSTVVSLTFTPMNPLEQAADEFVRGPQTYALSLETMDFPTKFTDDFGSAIAACAVANLDSHVNVGLAPTIRIIVSQLAKIIESPESMPNDVRTRARLLGCYAVALALQFDYTSNEDDLRGAAEASGAASQLLDDGKFSSQWLRQRSNHGAFVAQLGEFSGRPDLLDQAANITRELLPHLSDDLVSWSKIQMNLALMYYRSSLITGLTPSLLKSLDVYTQVATDELRDKDSTLWASVQSNHGVALQVLAEKQNDDAALLRALDAFTHALEVWTPKFIVQRAATLNSLAVALMALGRMQNILDWYAPAIEHLREAQELTSDRRNSRTWWFIENNLGLALSLLGEQDSRKCKEAISILRRAKENVAAGDIELKSKMSINLARALMISGRSGENLQLLQESRTLIEGLLPSIAIPDIRTDALNILGLTYRHLGVHEEDIGYLERSLEIFEGLSLADPPLTSATLFACRQNLGLTLREIGIRQASMARLRDSVTALFEALELTSKQTSQKSWAVTQFYLAGTYFEMSKQHPVPANLRNAQLSISEALSILGPEDPGLLAGEARRLGEEIREFENSIHREDE